MAVPKERLRVVDEPGALEAALRTVRARVDWGGVWAGLLAALGILLLLGVLGLAVGISAADLTGPDANARGVGIGAGIWALTSLVVALFVGGIMASRLGMVSDRTAGLSQGALVWVLAILALVYLAASGISLGVGTLFSALGGVTRGATSAIVGGAAASLGDLTSGDVSQIVQRLQDPKTVEMVAGATGMPRDQAQARLGEIRARVEAARDDPARAAAEAREGLKQFTSEAGAQVGRAAEAARPYAAATGWIAFAALLLSLGAAVGGAAVGMRQAAAR